MYDFALIKPTAILRHLVVVVVFSKGWGRGQVW